MNITIRTSRTSCQLTPARIHSLASIFLQHPVSHSLNHFTLTQTTMAGEDGLDYNLVIFLVIIGAAALALVAYAVARIWGDFQPPAIKKMSDEQLEYMRSVRERNAQWLYWNLRRGSKEENRTSASRSYVVSSVLSEFLPSLTLT